MRCRPLATDGGASICTTRSMAPMSMPSSSDEVATSARRRPALSRSSTSIRCAPRDRSVMRAHQRLARQLVQRAGQPLGQPAAVDEDQRRAVRANQLEQPRVDRRPDRRPRVADRRGSARDLVTRLRQPRHVLDRHFDGQRERLLRAGVDDGHRPVADRAARERRTRRRCSAGQRSTACVSAVPESCACRGARSAPPEKPRHFVERPLRRRQADALRRPLAARREPFDARARDARRAWSGRARESRR